MLSKRQRNILSYLSSEKGFVTISELASLFQVTERTIQYDLEFIESFKSELNIDVERNKSLGVKLSQKENDNEVSNV
ncbi:HTH domain-containing protein [Mammaliicoccus vitulinus]